MIGNVVSHYRIVEKLGAGGMGEVYVAEDLTLDRKVALKFLPSHYANDPAVLKRFEREAKAAAALNHSNIVTIHEIGTHEGRPFIAMSLVEGAPLRNLIDEKTLSIEKAVDIAAQVCDGLAAAHRAGIVHRDIKPENVVVDAGGRAKILDFGLAKVAHAGTLTEEQSTVGTVRYMSPEQARGEDVDHRSDLFSLGVVLYEMVAGQPPFRGEHAAAVLYAVTTETPQPLARFNHRAGAELERIVVKALAKDRAARYQSAEDFAADLRQAARTPASSGVTPRKRRLAIVVPIAAVLVLAAALLVLKPFESKQTATAAEKRLAILYFENMEEPADPQRLGEIATNLLITDLSESKYVSVVSSQRVYDILKQMGKEGVKVVDRSTATEVARAAGASEMLVGTVLRVHPNVELTSQLIDVASGEARATQRVRGAEGEDVFALIDRLSTEVKNDLGLPRKAGAEPEIAVADVTTHSAVAYRYYLEGIEEMNRYRFAQARASLEKAIQVDSTFAMAWVALTDHWMVDVAGLSPEQQKNAMAKAVAHSERVSERERRYIAAMAKKFAGDLDGAIVDFEALVVDFPDEKRGYYELARLLPADRPQEAIAALNKVIELDPMDKMAYNQLAYRYQSVDDLEKSIWAINQYLHLAPNDANAYDSQGELYGFNGQIEQAIAAYEKAVAIDPTFLLSWFKLGQLHLSQGRDERTRDCWANLAQSDVPEVQAWARLQLASIPLYHGRAGETIAEMEKAIAADRRNGYDGEALAHKHWIVGFLHVLRGEKPSADAAFRRAGKAPSGPEMLPRIALLAPLDVSRVEDDLRALQKIGGEGDESWVAKCWVEMARGQFAAAAETIDQAPGELPFVTTYTKGVAYLRSGRVAESTPLLERARDMQSFLNAFYPTWTVQVHYYLALAYESGGRNAEAMREYGEFLRRWGDGDIFRDQIDDASRRLAALKS